jgi:hypothetical protein
MIVVDCNWILTGLNMRHTALRCYSGGSGGCVNMDTSLSNCAILEQWAVMDFFWKEESHPLIFTEECQHCMVVLTL